MGDAPGGARGAHGATASTAGLVAGSELRRALGARLDAEAARRLDDALSAVERDARAIAARFRLISRAVGRAPVVEGADADDPWTWTVDDAARALLVVATGDAARHVVPDLYRHGEGRERRGVLRSLDVVEVADVLADAGLPLVEDALRSDDPVLVAAALGPYGARRLGDDALRRAVLQCGSVGLDPRRIEGAPNRAAREVAWTLAGRPAGRGG